MVTLTQTQLENPFPGLRPFSFAESHLYFGRERHTERTITQLVQNRFLSIVGASGVGKSSFVYCGIFHTLLQAHDTEDMPWQMIANTPADEPLMRLATSLAPFVEESIGDMYEQLRTDETALAQLLRKAHLQEPAKYLLFFDQFEEIFRHTEKSIGNQATEASQYIQLILHTVEQQDLNAYVIITMRSEFLDNCTQFPALANFLNKSQFLLPRMTKNEIRDVLTKPVALLGANIEPALVERVLQDTGEGTDQLPIMQHAMMRTWERWSRTSAHAGLPISIGDYEGVGTAKTALSVHANEVYAKLTDKERKICEIVFKTITEKGAEGRGVRRPTKLNVITDIVDAPISEVAKVIHAFRKTENGLLMPSEDKPLEPDTVIDISHESLMRIWEELSVWADKESESVKTYLRLADAAEMQQRGKTGLWRPPDLQLATTWRSEQNPSKAWAVRYEPAFERTMLFLQASEENYEKEQINKEKAQKRKVAAARGIAIGSIIAVVICVLFLLFALYKSQKAEEALVTATDAQRDAMNAKAAAEVSAKEALGEKAKAQVSAKEAAKAADAAELAAEDAREKEKIALEAQRSALVEKRNAEIASIAAGKAKDDALRQTKIANINKQISDINNKLAELEKEKALKASNDVKFMQMLSTAKALALKSIRIADLGVQATGAQQAYIMNKAYKGNPNDPDVYQGLYYAIKNLKNKDNPTFNQLKSHTSTVRSLVNANGLLYSTGSDGKVLQWNLDGKSYAEASTISPTPLTQVQQINRTMAVSNNGTVAVSGEYSEILILQNGKVTKRLPHTAREIWAMGFASDGKTLVTIDNRKIVSTWNTSEAAPQPKQILTSDIKINALTVNPANNSFAVGKESGEIAIYDFAGTLLKNWTTPEAITALQFSNKGDRLASGDEGGFLKIWNTANNAPIDEQKEHRARINHLAYSKDDASLASASFDRTVRIWNSQNLNQLPVVLDDHDDWVWSIAFSPDGKKLLAGCRDNVLRVWATQIEDMKGIICPELTAQNRRKELSKEEWERLIYTLEGDKKVPCTCCQ